jgi:hypothetical protein
MRRSFSQLSRHLWGSGWLCLPASVFRAIRIRIDQRHVNYKKLRVCVVGISVNLIVLGLAPAAASSANISHSYNADGSIRNGDIVSLDPSRSDYVQSASTNNGSRLLGVAVSNTDSLLAVDPTVGAAQVATSGNANTLVSNINGNIKVGDQVAVSPFDGIGMKALSGSHVIGLAQTAFNVGSAGASTEQVTSKAGKTSSVQVGYVRINIAIGIDTSPSGQAKLSGLQKIAESLTGNTLSNTRILLSIAVAIVAILSLIILIYSSIYSSIVSIGRNPLAKYTVFRALGSVLVMAVLTAGVAGVTIFFLIR